MLKWKGYSHESNTWEIESSLNCDHLLSKFEISWAKEIVGTKWSKNDLERQFLIRFKSGDSRSVGAMEAKQKWPNLTVDYIEKCLKWNHLARQNESTGAPIVLNELNVAVPSKMEPIEIVCELNFLFSFLKRKT